MAHLHIILWTAEKSGASIRNKITGSYRQLLYELGIAKDDKSNPKVEYDNDINDLIDLAKADFRCQENATKVAKLFVCLKYLSRPMKRFSN